MIVIFVKFCTLCILSHLQDREVFISSIELNAISPAVADLLATEKDNTRSTSFQFKSVRIKNMFQIIVITVTVKQESYNLIKPQLNSEQRFFTETPSGHLSEPRHIAMRRPECPLLREFTRFFFSSNSARDNSGHMPVLNRARSGFRRKMYTGLKLITDRQQHGTDLGHVLVRKIKCHVNKMKKNICIFHSKWLEYHTYVSLVQCVFRGRV